MPIQQGDIKLLASAVMDDVPEGGGAPTNHVIVDGKSNEIFKDISESDRARGRLNLAKVAVSVQTTDTDTYLGANVIVARPPEDPNVSITIFSMDDVYDTRTNAQDVMERYLNKSSEWNGYLFENHVTGQRSLQLFQRPGAELPPVGKTLVVTANEGRANQVEQYVRVQAVSSVVRTFSYNSGSAISDFEAQIATVELSDALRYDFPGSSPSRMFSRASSASTVRDTLVVDAAQYAGVTELAEPVRVGDFTIKVNNVFTQLVPSAQVETPIIATPPYPQGGVATPSIGPVTFSTSQGWSNTTNLVLPGGIYPGTLTITVAGSTIKDQGGLLMTGDTQIGTVDYSHGTLTVNSGSYSGTKTVTYQPSVYIQRFPQSSAVEITAESRSQNYTGFISPLAAPGSLTISYMAQGRWYVLADQGDGTLRGVDSSYGAGRYNNDTGDYVVTLGELPDVGSSLVLQWGVPTQEHAHPETPLKMSQIVPLDNAGEDDLLDPSYFNVTWADGSTTKTATAGPDGVLTGDATGQVDALRDEVVILPNSIPPVGTDITFEWSVGPRSVTNVSYPSRDGSGKLPVNAGAVGLQPGSVSLEWNTVTDANINGIYDATQLVRMGINIVDPVQTARDDGAGNLVRNGEVIGSVNYTTGAITFNPDVTIRVPRIEYSTQRVDRVPGMVGPTPRLFRLNYSGISYVPAASTFPDDESGWVKIYYHRTAGSARRTKTVRFQPRFYVLPGVSAAIVPGSVILRTSSGALWSDSTNGVIRELSDGAWYERGTINYLTGEIVLTAWPIGIGGTVQRLSTITTLGETVSSGYVFRTAAAPVRPGSLSLQFAAAEGGVRTVTASTDGVIDAPGITGFVDYSTGLVQVGFGEMVTAAGNESQPWYHSTRVQPDGKIFKPAPIVSSSLKYTAVAYSYMPLNADLIGIDPVRLPSDGRVPIFRAGVACVIGNSASTNPMTVTNNQTVNLGRTRLSRVQVRDADGVAVNSGYTADLDAGTVTFDDVSDITMPVTIENRIEDMAIARDVQISGHITFTRPVTHNYAPSDTYVSSALEFGDRRARVSAVFDQASWVADEWSDTPTSGSAIASYNTVLSPIEVTNAGASTERFALQFTSTSQFRVIGQHVGVIATGSINADCAPINPATGAPYFTIRALGWGTGWAVGNVLRINTVGALCPVWIARTIQPSAESAVEHSFEILVRGDVDRP